MSALRQSFRVAATLAMLLLGSTAAWASPVPAAAVTIPVTAPTEASAPVPSAAPESYAARESQAKSLESFKGGDTTVVLGGSALVIILLVVLIVVLI